MEAMELQDEVWQPLVLTETSDQSDTYFIKYRFTSNAYTLIVTNMHCIWVQKCEREEIKKAKAELKEYNPHLDTPMQRILLMLKQYLVDAAVEKTDKLQSIRSRIEIQDNELLLHFATKIEFYCFKWTFVCSLVEDEDSRLLYLKHTFVEPLIVIANEFNKQIEELQAIIAQKDAEIQEYRTRGVKLPKNMQTANFDAQDFVEKRLRSSGFLHSMRQPKFSFEGTAGIIYTKMKQQFPPGTSNTTTTTTTTTTTQSSDCPSSQSNGYSASQEGDSVGGSQYSSQFSSPPSSPPAACDYAVNQLNYQESPDEVKRRLAIRKRLEIQKQKKEEKVKTVKKRRFV